MFVIHNLWLIPSNLDEFLDVNSNLFQLNDNESHYLKIFSYLACITELKTFVKLSFKGFYIIVTLA